MININKIMKENVSINMNLDVENRGLWEKGNQLGCDTITLTISRNGKDTDVQVTLQEVTQGDTLFGDQEAVEN